jgi:hypothetical protein
MFPRPTGKDLIVKTENPDKVWFLATQNVYSRSAKRIVTYTVDARTDHIRAIAIQALKGGGTKYVGPHYNPPHWWTATLRVTTLSSAPTLPETTPNC